MKIFGERETIAQRKGLKLRYKPEQLVLRSKKIIFNETNETKHHHRKLHKSWNKIVDEMRSKTQAGKSKERGDMVNKTSKEFTSTSITKSTMKMNDKNFQMIDTKQKCKTKGAIKEQKHFKNERKSTKYEKMLYLRKRNSSIFPEAPQKTEIEQ